MKNLISMTDFVLQQDELDSDYYYVTLEYAKFLKQKHELWMFVPCKLVDGVWVVLEKPKEHLENRSLYFKELQEYQEAKERVLFEGCTLFGKQIAYGLYLLEGITIEDLVKYNLELTTTAQKQIGL